MKILLYCALLMLALAAFRWAAVLLLIAGALMLLWGAWFRPSETFGFLALNLFSEMLKRYPVMVCSLCGMALMADVIRRWCRSGAGESHGRRRRGCGVRR